MHQDPTWDEEALDKHYEESCPWLTCCEKCEQVCVLGRGGVALLGVFVCVCVCMCVCVCST